MRAIFGVLEVGAEAGALWLGCECSLVRDELAARFRRELAHLCADSPGAGDRVGLKFGLGESPRVACTVFQKLHALGHLTVTSSHARPDGVEVYTLNNAIAIASASASQCGRLRGFSASF